VVDGVCCIMFKDADADSVCYHALSDQFTSLSVDPSGEIVCAGALDPFEVYVW